MDFSSFKWINETGMHYEDGVLTLKAAPRTDFFNDPVKKDGHYQNPVENASIFYTELTGNFVFRAQVETQFKDLYDACAFMIWENTNVWAKLALENSDMPCRLPAVVSVVTNVFSDDCNGPVIHGNSVWLQICRVDNVFGFQYSLDGEEWNMVRIFQLPVGKTVKVGFEAQAPLSDGGERIYKNISIGHRTVASVRVGV